MAGATLGSRVMQGRLPVPATPLVGRDRELERLRDLLARSDVRMLALIGPGGVGKTRLAIAAAAECASAFEEGLLFVDLAPINDPHLVPDAIAQAAGLQERPSPSISEALLEYFAYKHLLLVLDNFEHLLAGAGFISTLLESCERLKVLATSRIVLGLYGEHEVPVPPMELPDINLPPDQDQLANCDAVRLFVERAQAADPDFALTNANASAVTSICRRLDGLPLAIELAAARIRLLSPQMLLDRLQRRLEFLGNAPRGFPERHQTIRAAIGWSYNLLSTAELFRRLGVFAGGVTFESAAALTTFDAAYAPHGVDRLEGLRKLLDASLIWKQPSDEPRFRMLETIREYALEQLDAAGELEATQRVYVNCWVEFVEAAARREVGPEQRDAWDALTLELDNIRGALQWCVQHDSVEPALRMVGALWRFWHLRGYLSEGRDWSERVLALASEPCMQGLRVRALFNAANLARVLGDYSRARVYGEEGLATAQSLSDPELVARAQLGLGLLALTLDDDDAALESLEKTRTMCAAVGDGLGQAVATDQLALIALHQTNWQTSRQLIAEALSLYRELGDSWGIAHGLWGLGNVLRAQGSSTTPGQPTRRVLPLSALADASKARRKFSRSSAGLPWSRTMSTKLNGYSATH